MSTKTEIVVYRAFYCKVFLAIFRRMSFSTATGDFTQNPCGSMMSVIEIFRQSYLVCA
jgi:hypothetical protein